jgi:hypothetical protein
MWERWLPHRGALANQGELGKKARTLEEIEGFETTGAPRQGNPEFAPGSATSWTRSADTTRRQLCSTSKAATPVERINELMPRLEEHLSNV